MYYAYIAFRVSDGTHPLDREAKYIDSECKLFSLPGQNLNIYERFEEGNYRAKLLARDIENPAVPEKYSHIDSPVLILPYGFYYQYDLNGNKEKVGLGPYQDSPLLVTSLNLAKSLILHSCIGYDVDWDDRPSATIFSEVHSSLGNGLMFPFGNLKLYESFDIKKVSDYVDAVWLDKTRFDKYGDSWLLNRKINSPEDNFWSSSDTSHTWFPSEEIYTLAKESFRGDMDSLKRWGTNKKRRQVDEAFRKATEKWNGFLRQCIRNGTIVVSY